MLKNSYLWLGLCSAATAFAATTATPLGIVYSERIGTSALNSAQSVKAAVDGQGAVYAMASGSPNTLFAQSTSYVLKIAPGGNQAVYQVDLGFYANFIAADSGGNVYVTGPNFVEKLNTTGTATVYKTVIGQKLVFDGFAVDSTGRAYVIGHGVNPIIKTTANAFQKTLPAGNISNCFVARLDTTGAIDYLTYLDGSAREGLAAIAVDSTGSAYIAGQTWSPDFPITKGSYNTNGGAYLKTLGAAFLTRLSSDGSSVVYSTYSTSEGDESLGVAVDPSGNATLILAQGFPDPANDVNLQAGNLIIEHFDPAGDKLIFSTILPRAALTGLAMDANGTTYLASYTQSAIYPPKSSLAICTPSGSPALTLYDSSGNILQSTYLAGVFPTRATVPSFPFAVGPDSTVYVVGWPNSSYTPTRGTGSGPLILTSLSASAKSQPVQLACVGNSGSFDPGSVAPGEIVSLFGENLGPATGTSPSDVSKGFPNEVGNVQVTFNGTPGPLLYVQANQINAIAPFALQPGTTADVCVVYNGTKSNCLQWPVTAAAPGVFTLDSFHAACLNQDQTINSPTNPAKPGTIVSIFATGLGAITPSQDDGSFIGVPLPKNVYPADVAIQIRGLVNSLAPMKVEYAGPAPYLVAGANQINFTVVDAAPIVQVQVTGTNGIQSRPFTVYVATQ